MQNKYVGDIGDFGKFGLLSSLAAGVESQRLRLGVLWYLVPDEKDSHDGRKINYPHLETCDPGLYKRLKELIELDMRTVGAVENSGILPPDTLYFSDPLSFSKETPIRSREQAREGWIRRAMEEFDAADLIFADPDNGLEIPSCGKMSVRGPKYAFFDDFRTFVGTGRSLVVYQHRNRTPLDVQVTERRRQIALRLGISDSITLLWKSRLFFIIPSPRHDALLRSQVEEFLEGPWGEHFETR